MLAIYYDRRIADISMEFIKRGVAEEALGVVKKVDEVKIVDYDSVSEWLENRKAGDVLVFFQDVMPYTAFNADYVDMFSLKSPLARFLKMGGIVVWIGDVPFFYRVKCVESSAESRVKEAFQMRLHLVPHRRFFREKFMGRVVEKKFCYRDMIAGWYLSLDSGLLYLGSTKFLDFFDLSNVCYADKELEARPTVLGKLLGYNTQRAFRPVKASSRLELLNELELNSPSCRGHYAGGWIRRIGEGYFVRLFDYPPSVEELKKAVEIGLSMRHLVE